MDCIAMKQVVTRKAHKCWGCGRPYPKGTSMERITNVDGGEIMTTHWCPVCSKFWDMHRRDLQDDGIDLGAFSYELDWEELRAKMEGAVVTGDDGIYGC